MKRLLMTLISVVMIAVAAHAQTKVYGTIIANVKLTSGKATVEVFFGDNQEEFSHLLKDKQGNTIQFTSLVDAMNHLAKYGWELEDTYSMLIGSGISASTAYYWVISKKN